MIWLPLITFIGLGILLAKAWLVRPSPRISKIPRGFRIIIFILLCWIGTFITSSIAREIGYHQSGGIAYDEGVEVPYDVMHDGTGDNVVNLFLGWISGYLFWGIASIFWKKKTTSSASTSKQSPSRPPR